MVPIPVAAIEGAGPPTFVASSLPACAAGQLSLSLDGEGGTFDGMSHGGTLLVLRNLGPRACRLTALPRLSFSGADGGALPIAFRPPAGMHPGPAVPPVGVAAGAEVTATLRWVSGDVYPSGRCLSPASVSVAFDAVVVASAFAGRLCGPAGAPVPYEQSWLKADPRPGR